MAEPFINGGVDAGDWLLRVFSIRFLRTAAGVAWCPVRPRPRRPYGLVQEMLSGCVGAAVWFATVIAVISGAVFAGA